MTITARQTIAGALDAASMDAMPEFDYRALAKQALAQDIAALQRRSLAGSSPVQLYEGGWAATAACGLIGALLLVVGTLAGLQLKRWAICGVAAAGGLQLLWMALRRFWVRRKPFAILSHQGIRLPDLDIQLPWHAIHHVATVEQLNLSANATTIVNENLALIMAKGYAPPAGVKQGSRTRYQHKLAQYLLPNRVRGTGSETAAVIVTRYWRKSLGCAHATDAGTGAE